ncbi:MAG TPA: lysylphosphatidylglycerol synthase transmembrane domain-containing protein [Luteimonas sp.]|nr:lysylphosphatidylglycerol synthase transmembrane domain-containing protein [Luteimonas sp.]
MLSRSHFVLALKLVVGLTLTGALLSRMDWVALGSALRQYTPGAILAALALTAMSMFIAGLRWKVLAPEIRFSRLLKFTLIGQFYSLVLPGQISGDAVRAWRISRGVDNRARVAMSVLADRVVGLVALLLVSIVGLALSTDDFARKILPPVVVLTAGIVAVLLLLRLAFVRLTLTSFVTTAGNLIPGTRTLSDKLGVLILAWCDATNDLRAVAMSLILGIVFQLMGVAIFAILASCLAIELGWGDWMWIAGMTTIALLLPITLGGLGVREGTLMVILAQYSVPGEKAIALSFGLLSMSAAVALAGWLADVTESTRPVPPDSARSR